MIRSCFRGPDIAVVGWIPYFDRIADLPIGHKYPPSVAMHLLFNSGNNEPPLEFSGGYNEFLSWLDIRRDYRAALYVRDVMLRYEENKPAPIISFQAQGIMGYTPPRLTLAGITVALPGRLGQLKGVSPNDYTDPTIEPLPDNRGVKILFTFQFKLSPMMDTLQRALTGRWAPNAWGAIEYELRSTGRTRIAVAGTSIPSQAVYVDWKRVDDLRFDMLESDAPAIRGFLNETAGCADAPRAISRTRTEIASECDKI